MKSGHELLKAAQFHGAKRLVADKYGWSWAWGSALLTLFVISACVVAALIVRYIDNPTFLVQLSSVVSGKAFPSVTVCPEITFPEHKVDAFLDEIAYPPGFERPYLRKITWQLAAFYSLDVDYSTEELMRMEYVLRYNDLDVESTVMRLMTSCEEMLVRPPDVESVVMRQLAAFYSLHVDYSAEQLMRMEYVLRYNELGVESTVMRLMTSCEEMLLRCRWRNQMVNCSEIFHMQVTGDGICCIFNSKSLRHELDPLHATHIKPQVKWYTTLVGPAHGLTLLINQTQKHGSIDITYKWVTIHHSLDYVDSSRNGSALSPGYEHWFSYATYGFAMSDKIMELSPNLRKCRIYSEEPLEWFPAGGKLLCTLECEMRFTARQCGCLRPNHPLPPGLRACRAYKLACARHAGVSVSSTEFCDCPSTCQADRAIIRKQSFPLALNNATLDPIYQDIKDVHQVSVVRAYVGTYKMRSYRRELYFTYTDLFAQIGGIFNVYFGCSVLTLLEIIIICYRTIVCKRLTNKVHDERKSNNVVAKRPPEYKR